MTIKISIRTSSTIAKLSITIDMVNFSYKKKIFFLTWASTASKARGICHPLTVGRRFG